MIRDLRVVQDHGWIQQNDGTLIWAPTKYWLEALDDNGEWAPLKVHMLNEQPNPDDPLYESNEDELGSEETLAHRTRIGL